ncbi:anaphase-promoting complex subunit 1-like isoform X3 [Nylanderia fulva]|uniref:anaphase-promoting complex subunit 1-like isoform X3 n=1 Tax=Nylanderia fulva TaxID=613905 RepID=UPI0010FB5C0A|nr:anaphase-promoting complex subunit 1-like isoform X3 [Nylanderia fulva]
MIAASKLVTYMPAGRQIIFRHPGSLNSQQSSSNEIINKKNILNRFDEVVNISEKIPKETWLVRNNESGVEEELYYSDIQHALWCTFHMNIPNYLTKDKKYENKDSICKSIKCICVLDSYTLSAFTESGENYVSALQFQVSAVWPMKYGIILERCPKSVTDSRRLFESSRLPQTRNNNLPVAFSLKHPLDEICPLLIKHESVSYMNESTQQIIFTSLEPSLAVIYDSKSCLHSVYKIRKVLAEECETVDRSNDTSLLNHSINMSSLNVDNNLSINKSRTKKELLSSFHDISNFHMSTSDRPSTSQQWSQYSMDRTPHQTLAHAASRFSDDHPINDCFYHNILSTIIMKTTNQTHNSFVNRDIQLKNTASRPLYPEICFEYIWTENVSVTKDIVYRRASKVFLTSDFVGQNYLGYLIPNRSQLYLVTLEKTNEPEQIIFGTITRIAAKDAVNLSNLHMIAIIDLSNNITLYTGVMCVGKLHVPDVLSLNLMSGSFFVSSSNSKLPSLHKIEFEESIRLLTNFVGDGCARPPIPTESSLLDTNFLALKDAIDNEIIVECEKQQYFRIRLPVCNTSFLVTKCLHTLRSVLEKDLAMQLLIKWYGARNAPGPQDLSPEQEWNLFLTILFPSLGYNVEKLSLIQINDEKDQFTEHVSKKQKNDNCISTDDWLHILKLDEHKNAQAYITNVLKCQKAYNFPCTTPESNSATRSRYSIGKINVDAVLYPHLPLVLFSLHLLYEELKLNSLRLGSLSLLGQLLYQLSLDLKFEMYAHHYFLDSPSLLYSKTIKREQISHSDLQKITIPNYMPRKPPNVFKTLNSIILNEVEITAFPYLRRVNPRTRNLIYLIALESNENRIDVVEVEKYIELIIPDGNGINVQESDDRFDKEISIKSERSTTDRIILLYHEMGMTKDDLEILPPAISLIIRDVISKCKECPPLNWPMYAYEFIERQDLVALNKLLQPSSKLQCKTFIDKTKDSEKVKQGDGMEFDYTILKLRFRKDQRVAEVRRLLNSSIQGTITLVQYQNESNNDFLHRLRMNLYIYKLSRTMALPVGRGMFTLRTSTSLITEKVPPLCLTAKASPGGEIVSIDTDLFHWPLFHNGVAAGLCIHPDAANIDSSYIVSNISESWEERAGFLMALGLNGHLKHLDPLNMCDYFGRCHDFVNLGLILGLSATHRGTMSLAMTKLLTSHIKMLLPPKNNLHIDQNTQIAALMGIGLVYQGTVCENISTALLIQIAIFPKPRKMWDNHESYSLTAGLALGLVTLGSNGTNIPTYVLDFLHYYMVGGKESFFEELKNKYKFCSFTLPKDESININITSPAATIALGLMYFDTGNRTIAEWMKVPEEIYLLESIRPDFLLLRVLAKSLILWKDIEPTKSWISSHVPDIVNKFKLQELTPESVALNIDLETINLAYLNIIAGACMALGLRYAGTANKNAFKILYFHTRTFMHLTNKIRQYKSILKATIATCLNIILLSFTVVMAGTGNLYIMRICRQLHKTHARGKFLYRMYDSQMATHMALGFLFLGGGKYTLSNSPNAVAALIISLFPVFPRNESENKQHLQAFRHFYVLAVEPRVILPRDIDTGEYCWIPIHLTFETDRETKGQEFSLQIVKAPDLLLPPLSNLKRIELKNMRYCPIVLEKHHNWQQLKNMLERHFLSIKKKAGHLSYLEDPFANYMELSGSKSLINQTLTMRNVIPWVVQSKYLVSSTRDQTLLNIITYFLQCFKREITRINIEHLSQNDDQWRKPSEFERSFLQECTRIIYKCVMKDKVSLIPLWLHIISIQKMIEKQPNSFSTWQIKLLSSQMSRRIKWSIDDTNLPFFCENILAIKQKMTDIFNKWEYDVKLLLKQYLTDGMIQTNAISLARMCAYFIFYDIPYPIDNRNFFMTMQHSSDISNIGRYKLYKILQPTLQHL